MRRPAPFFRPALGAVVALLAATTVAETSLARHFELRRSAPEAEAVLDASPEHIQLWFSQEPQTEGARIRLVDGAGDLVELGATTAVPDTATSLRADVPTSLAAGAYTIHWRAMARDGHLVTGEIPFEVRSDSDAPR
jgi:methionine-rich copper-binding protein CopC